MSSARRPSLRWMPISMAGGWADHPHGLPEKSRLSIASRASLRRYPASNGLASAVLVGEILHVTIQADRSVEFRRAATRISCAPFLEVHDVCERPNHPGYHVSHRDPAAVSGRSLPPPRTTALSRTWTARDPGSQRGNGSAERDDHHHCASKWWTLQPPALIPTARYRRGSIQWKSTILASRAVFDLVDLNPGGQP